MGNSYSPLDSMRNEYDHRGRDVKETVASLIFHNLQNKRFKVFLDKKSIQVGESIRDSIQEAIQSASVHIVIFSANHAESAWYLSELQLILKTRIPIIPVFCGVEPSELRMKDKGGVYACAFRLHKKAGRVGSCEEWETALRDVSHINGYHFKGDQGELLERIATAVSQYIGRAKSQRKQGIYHLKIGKLQLTVNSSSFTVR